MMRIEESVVVERPIEEVFAFLTDPARLPEWQATSLSARLEGDGPMTVGSRLHEVRKFLGKRIESTTEVVEYEPPRRFAIRAASGPVPFQFTSTLTAAGAGTRIDAVMEGEPGGFFKLAGPLVERAGTREIKAQFAAMKRILEGGTG